MPKAKGPEFWATVRESYEAGVGPAELSRRFDVSVTAVANHKKKGNWSVKQGEQVPPPEPELPKLSEVAVEMPVAGDPATSDATVWDAKGFSEKPSDDEVVDDLNARIKELEEQVAFAEAEAERLSPVTTHVIPSTAAEVLDTVGVDVMRELALARLGKENIQRFRDGKPPLDYNDNPELLESKVNELAQKLADARKRPINLLYRQRTLKMKKPPTEHQPNGMLVQVAVEEQINNEAGQAGAAIWKAREKGMKLIEPFLCQARDCWMEAAVSDFGEISLNGYCTPEHRALDPYLNEKPIAGVATSRTVQF